MNHLKPLVMMQLKDKIDFSFTKSKKTLISKIVFTALGFIAITALCYLLFWAGSTFKVFSLYNEIPLTVIVFVFSIMFLLSCITCSVGLMKNLYMATDNQVLLTMPVKSNMVYVSKLVVYYIYELIKNFYFMFPLLFAYGFFCKFEILYYPWLIFCFLFISLLPVLIGALISIPLSFIVNWLKQAKYVRIALFAILIGVVVFMVIKAISIIPENINIIGSWNFIYYRLKEFLEGFSKTFVPFSLIVKLICGEKIGLYWHLFSLDTIIILLEVICAVVVLFSIGFLIARPLFFKMASKPFEYRKKLIKNEYLNKFRSARKSAIIKEVKSNFRQPEILYNYLSILIVLPVSILLLNKIFSAMNTKLFGSYLISAFNILLILLILLASNVIIASIYSKDARTSYYMKTIPLEYKKYLFPKLFLSIIFAFIAVITTVVIFNIFSSIGLLNSIFMVLSLFGVYIGHMFWSAEMDLMNPQNEQYATTGTHSSNPNERKSTIFGFLLSGLLFGMSLLLFIENSNVAWLKLALIGIGFATIRIYLYFTRIKVFYKEK